MTGTPPAQEANFTIDYNVRNKKGINIIICHNAFILIHGFGKKRVYFGEMLQVDHCVLNLINGVNIIIDLVKYLK